MRTIDHIGFELVNGAVTGGHFQRTSVSVIPGLTKPAPYSIRGNPVFLSGFPLPAFAGTSFAGMTLLELLVFCII